MSGSRPADGGEVWPTDRRQEVGHTGVLSDAVGDVGGYTPDVARRMGLDSAVLGLGHKSISELGRADFYIPEGFERALGADAPSPVRA
ncbi:hypothetical protein SCMU_09510 [Sinomonas cyclohexanicum]|uniref:Uncharacterized protein n=1 Tax=Sinomonas cyclohexanicum TaxID=322009 RepID=A0ABM7PSB5_SINCY|nr:hypothetical protein SCMU_09510 [Corynebacterium cyclohexanicum]